MITRNRRILLVLCTMLVLIIVNHYLLKVAIVQDKMTPVLEADNSAWKIKNNSLQKEADNLSKLDKALNQILHYFNQLEMPIAKIFQNGLTREEIQSQVQTLPFRVPKEVYDFYQWQNGTQKDRPVDYEFLPGGYLLSLSEALEDYHSLTGMAKQIEKDSGVEASLIWNPRWFPLFRSISGDYYVIVCDKKEKKTSPIFFIDGEDRESSYMAYDSLTSMMLTIAQAFETGGFVVDENGILQEDPKKIAQITNELNPKRTEKLLKDVKDVDMLIDFLSHKDGRVRGKAAQALILLQDEKAVDRLIEVLRHEDPGVRGLTVRVLGELRNRQAVDPLIETLEDQSSYVRMEVPAALGYIGDTKAVEPLISALKDPDITVRAKTIWALGELRDSKAVEPLIQCLNTDNGMLWSSAAMALGKIKDKKAIDPLIQSLNDDFQEVRQLAAWALGEIGDSKAMEPLQTLLQDKNEIVQKNAKEAIEKIKKTSKYL